MARAKRSERRARRGLNVDRVEQLLNPPPKTVMESGLDLTRRDRLLYPKPVKLTNRAKQLLDRPPRQLSLATKQKRAETVTALELAAGRPIGRRTRAKLKGRVPEVLRRAICSSKRSRRAIMFATGKAGKGKRAAARRKPTKKIGSC